MDLENHHATNVVNNIDWLLEQLSRLERENTIHTINFKGYYCSVADNRLNSVSRSLLELMLEGSIEYSKFKFYMDGVERVRNRFFQIIRSVDEGLELSPYAPSINRLLSSLDNLDNLLKTDFLHSSERAPV